MMLNVCVQARAVLESQDSHIEQDTHRLWHNISKQAHDDTTCAKDASKLWVSGAVTAIDLCQGIYTLPRHQDSSFGGGARY